MTRIVVNEKFRKGIDQFKNIQKGKKMWMKENSMGRTRLGL